MKFRSTFSQIVWLQVLAIAATSLVMPVAIFLFLDRTMVDYQVRMLRTHEQALLGALTSAADGGLALPERVAAPYRQGVGGFAFYVLDTSGRVLLTSDAGGAPLAPVPGGRRLQVFRHQADGVSWFGVSFPEQVQGRPVWIQVGQNLANPDVVLDDVLAGFLPQVGWLSALLLLLLLAADVVIVRRALKPVLQASQLAGEISPSRMDVRLPSERMPQEVRPLTDAVNRALDRLADGFRAQRDLTADVAHELRTPLALLRMRADLVADAGLKRQLLSDIDKMTRTVSQLLAIAELENVVPNPADRADLRLVCLEVVEHFAFLAVVEGKEIELVGARGPVWVGGQHDFLFQAVRNLVENALAHTRPATRVTVEVGEDGCVRVLDRGPGIPAGNREQLFERFWRRRRERSAVGAGAGLGLSIVAKIAESHDGAVRVEDRPGGGSIFILKLLRRPPPAFEG